MVLLFRVHHIDHGTGLFVIHGQIDVVHVILAQGILQDIVQGLVGAAFFYFLKQRAIFRRSLFFTLSRGKAAVNAHDFVSQFGSAAFIRMVHGYRSLAGQIERQADVLLA